jgi:non-ribosomal peptide synthetase component F
VGDIVGDFTSTVLLEVDATAAAFENRARAVQKRLWQDLEHRIFGGVKVLRELRRARGVNAAKMPVVFTSTLSLESGAAIETDLPWKEGGSHDITQTPQVLLDHQLSERAGSLSFNWDYVTEVFPPGMIEDMFAGYRQLLSELASDERAWTA